MECAEIKKIIPKYFQHTASEEEIRLVEEHLCSCHDCRTILGELMDNAEKTPLQVSEKAEEPLAEEKIKETSTEKDKDKNMEYFPGEDIESSMDKINEILEKAGSVKEEVKKEKAEEKVEEPIEEEEVSKPFFEEKTEEPIKETVVEDSGVSLKEDVEKAQEEPDAGISRLKEEPILEEDDSKSFLAEEEEKKEPLKAPDPLDKSSSERGTKNFLEYFCLISSLAILGFLAYLLLKG